MTSVGPEAIEPPRSGAPNSARNPPRSKPPARKPAARRGFVGLLLSAIVAFTAVYAIQLAVRRAVGEYWIAYPTRESLERAVALIPTNHLGWLKLAVLVDRSGEDPAAALELYRRATDLQPYDAQSLIAYAIKLESSGELAPAEQHLLHAADLDLGFFPRWSLANFYLRHGDEDEFWRWVRAGLKASPAAMEPLMSLCWRAFDDPDVILRRGVPDDRPALNSRYFSFLIVQRHYEGLDSLWQRIQDRLQPEDLSASLSYVDFLLPERTADAVRVWNRLCAARLLSFDPLSPDSGDILTNPGFSQPLGGGGFNWTTPEAEGVERSVGVWEDASSGFQVEFSGRHPEEISLLSQSLPVTPLARYRLSFEYLASGLPSKTGVEWRITDAQTNRELALSPALEIPDSPEPQPWRQAELDFSVPSGASLVVLGLRYRRSPGTVRRNGLLRLRNLSSERLDEVASN